MSVDRSFLIGALLLAACVFPSPTSSISEGDDAVRDTVTALFTACVEEEKTGNPDVCLAQMSRDADFREVGSIGV